MQAEVSRQKGYKGLPMEGFVARRYAKLRQSGNQIEEWRKQAAQLTAGLPDGADILELAPGPGYFAIELARLGRFHVAGLDISRTFVEIEHENALQAGVEVAFQLGDASQMPFADSSFDFIVCQAAFKNFSRPTQAIDEMYRVLRTGGTSVIQDLRKEATDAGIRAEVEGMALGRFGAFMTRRVLVGLRRRAYTAAQFQEMASTSRFGQGETTVQGIGVELRMTKRPIVTRPGR
jgi:ubiquinone/menaquinone biosynthesis C-methylase UbiE